jgi:large subunit ribosomal protein L19
MARNLRNLMELVEKANLKQAAENFSPGDTVDVHLRIVEGEKERIQIFSGTVIGKKGSGTNRTFTVRRLVSNEGVERVFPFNCPSIDHVEVRKKGRVRRAKLYYLRDRVGKATRIAEKIGETGAAEGPLPVEQAVKPRQAAAVKPKTAVPAEDAEKAKKAE